MIQIDFLLWGWNNVPTYDYLCTKCGYLELFHSMNESITVCPTCEGTEITKCLSAGSGIIVKNREANQYRDIKAAKYWRDKNGVRHKVTQADGYTGSATVNKQTATPQQIEQRKKQDQKTEKARRMKLQKTRADQWNKDNCK